MQEEIKTKQDMQLPGLEPGTAAYEPSTITIRHCCLQVLVYLLVFIVAVQLNLNKKKEFNKTCKYRESNPFYLHRWAFLVLGL